MKLEVSCRKMLNLKCKLFSYETLLLNVKIKPKINRKLKIEK